MFGRAFRSDPDQVFRQALVCSVGAVAQVKFLDCVAYCLEVLLPTLFIVVVFDLRYFVGPVVAEDKIHLFFGEGGCLGHVVVREALSAKHLSASGIVCGLCPTLGLFGRGCVTRLL